MLRVVIFLFTRSRCRLQVMNAILEIRLVAVGLQLGVATCRSRCSLRFAFVAAVLAVLATAALRQFLGRLIARCGLLLLLLLLWPLRLRRQRRRRLLLLLLRRRRRQSLRLLRPLLLRIML